LDNNNPNINTFLAKINSLSKSERTTAALLADGKSIEEISRIRDRSTMTIKAYQAMIFRKLDITSQAELQQYKKYLSAG